MDYEFATKEPTIGSFDLKSIQSTNFKILINGWAKCKEETVILRGDKRVLEGKRADFPTWKDFKPPAICG